MYWLPWVVACCEEGAFSTLFEIVFVFEKFNFCWFIKSFPEGTFESLLVCTGTWPSLRFYRSVLMAFGFWRFYAWLIKAGWDTCWFGATPDFSPMFALESKRWLGATWLLVSKLPFGLGGIEFEPYCDGFLSTELAPASWPLSIWWLALILLIPMPLGAFAWPLLLKFWLRFANCYRVWLWLPLTFPVELMEPFRLACL